MIEGEMGILGNLISYAIDGRNLGTYCLGILGDKSHAYGVIHGNSLIFWGKMGVVDVLSEKGTWVLLPKDQGHNPVLLSNQGSYSMETLFYSLKDLKKNGQI